MHAATCYNLIDFEKVVSLILSFDNSIGYICYNDACHLQKYAQNPCRSHLTKTADAISNLKFVIDRMHMKGHTDTWCKRSCDPKLFPQLNNVSQNITTCTQ